MPDQPNKLPHPILPSHDPSVVESVLAYEFDGLTGHCWMRARAFAAYCAAKCGLVSHAFAYRTILEFKAVARDAFDASDMLIDLSATVESSPLIALSRKTDRREVVLPVSGSAAPHLPDAHSGTACERCESDFCPNSGVSRARRAASSGAAGLP